MKRIYGLFAIAVVAIAALLFLQPEGKEAVPVEDGKKQVIASFFPVYFFAQAIGGDHADVHNLTPSGVEPHDYEPTPRDIARLEASDLILLNGGGLEAWAENLEEVLKNEVEIIKLGDDLATRSIEAEGEIARDPHVWLAPRLVKKEVVRILQAFIKIDPANRGYYESNASALSEKLDKLDEDYKNGLKDCRQRTIVTAHAAFSYMAEAYGLKQVAISGLSPDEEPSQQDLARVAEFARKENVRYIFFESLVDPGLSETVAREIGARTLVLDPLESGVDYFDQMYSNLANLQLALECRK